VKGIDSGGEAQGVEALYTASYARLVGVVGSIAQDRHEAEEAVQDAFVRLLGQWRTVSAYDDPEAWVRKVALGFLSNRRRKLRNGARALIRTGPSAHQAAPTGDAVDLRRALAALPRAQREVVVLQQLALTVQEIAHELDIPVGTVKSRLSRARAALAPLVREENERV
jgi:RNA polymerase sigma-70 factor (ECF subfamily)